MSEPERPNPPAKRARAAHATAAPDDARAQADKQLADIVAMRAAVDDAAGSCATFWLPFLLFQFYLAFSVGSVSNIDLFLNRTLSVPLANIALPLPAFFCLAPALLLILHAFVLALFVILAERARRLREMMEAFEAAGFGRCEDLRRQLSSNVFVQYLLGPRDLRTGAFGWALRVIAWVSLAIGPVATLLLLQARFLPYQFAPLTWLHSAALGVDFALLWWLWSKGLGAGPDSASGRIARACGYAGRSAMALSLAVSLAFATDAALRLPLLPALNQLVLTSENLTAIAGIAPGEAKYVYRARGRSFRGAVFDNAILTHIDFNGASLEGASFAGAQLDGSSFDAAALAGASFRGATARGVSFEEAQLARADFSGANLAGADFAHAKLPQAQFESAGLRGTDFLRADLHAASFAGSVILAARFERADLSGANLKGAGVKASDFNAAALDSASVNHAEFKANDFQGATGVGALLGAALRAGFSAGDAQAAGATGAEAGAECEAERLRAERADLFAEKLCRASPDNAFIMQSVVFRSLRGAQAIGMVKTLLSADCATSETLTVEQRVGLGSWRARLADPRRDPGAAACTGSDDTQTLARLSRSFTAGGFPTIASDDR